VRDKRRLILKDGIAEEHHFVIRHGHPDRSRGWPRMLFQDDRLFAPMQCHLICKRNFRRRPSHRAEAGDGLPIRTGFISLRFECGRPYAKDRRSFSWQSQCSPWCAHPVCGRMCIEVDEHAFRAGTESHQCGAPSAAIFGCRRRVDLDQTARLLNHAQCRAR